MARALECPACGHRHRLDTIPASPTFRCEQCGQVLKTPASVSSQPGGPPPPARGSAQAAPAGPSAAQSAAQSAAPSGSTSSTGAPAPVAPPPRRTVNAPAGDPSTRAAPVRTAAGVSATVAATAAVEEGDASGRGRRAKGVPAPAPAPVGRAKVAWYWRVVAWIVAVPLGFLLTAWPAYKLGFIKKADLLDIFVGTGTGRYLRIAVVTLVWAVVTALLVQLFVEGGRLRANRRRRARASAA